MASASLPKLIVYGNCQGWAVSSVLSQTPEVSRRWQVVYHDLWPDEARLAREITEFDEAEVLLLQNIRNWNSHPMRDRLPAHMRVVRFPFCYVGALWPFDAFLAGPDQPMVDAMLAAKAKGEPFPFGFQDGLMARLRKQFPDPAERLDRYTRLDVDGIPDIKRYAEFEEARLLAEDRLLNSAIGRFIVDNYRSIRLFHALVHPDHILVDYVVRELLIKMGLDPTAAPTFNDVSMRENQVPLHPTVITLLNLQWLTPTILYRNKAFGLVSFANYFAAYARYI